jgi:rhodanese-related sulfurtransferase
MPTAAGRSPCGIGNESFFERSERPDRTAIQYIMKTGAEMIAQAKAQIREVTPKQVREMQDRGEPVTLLDCRDLQEVNLGRIPNAAHISRGNLETKIEAVIPRDANLVIYCASGNRSALAAVTLEEMGYENVASMSGGFRGWVEAGGDVE